MKYSQHSCHPPSLIQGRKLATHYRTPEHKRMAFENQKNPQHKLNRYKGIECTSLQARLITLSHRDTFEDSEGIIE